MKIKNKKKIFITGSNGFIGTHLSKKLSKKFKVYKPTRKSLNLLDEKKIQENLNKTKPDILIHLASSTKFYFNKNLEKKNQFFNTYKTTINIAKNINKECKLIIFFGSIEEYGKSKKPFSEGSICKPISYYGKYKLKSFFEIQKIMKEKKSSYIWLRPSLTYGKGDNKERFLGGLITSIKEKRTFKMDSSKKIRDFLYIDDLCKIVLLILNNEKKKYPKILNLSSKNYIQLLDIPNIVGKIKKEKIKVKYIKKNNINIDLINSNKNLLKIFPKIKFTSFKNGIKKLI